MRDHHGVPPVVEGVGQVGGAQLDEAAEELLRLEAEGRRHAARRHQAQREQQQLRLVRPLAQVEPPLEQPDAAAAAREQLDADQLLRAAGPRALAGRGRRELAQRVPPLLDLRRIRGRLRPSRRRLGIGAQQARTRRDVLRLPR